MITTVTLDPWLEQNVRLSVLAPGTEQAAESKTVVRGRGLDVNFALRALGAANFAIGFSRGSSHALLEELLEQRTVCGCFVRSHGEPRMELNLMEQATGTRTTVRSKGDAVVYADVELYLHLLQKRAECSDVIAFCGGVPHGVEDGIYRRSLAVLRGVPVRVLLAACGGPLREALRAKPHLVCMTEKEFKCTFHLPAGSRGELLESGAKVVERGAGAVCILSDEGSALLVDRMSGFFVPGMDFPTGPAAAGAFLAGLCLGLRENAGPERMLRCAVAAERAVAGLTRRLDWEQSLREIRVEQV